MFIEIYMIFQRLYTTESIFIKSVLSLIYSSILFETRPSSTNQCYLSSWDPKIHRYLFRIHNSIIFGRSILIYTINRD